MNATQIVLAAISAFCVAWPALRHYLFPSVAKVSKAGYARVKKVFARAKPRRKAAGPKLVSPKLIALAILFAGLAYADPQRFFPTSIIDPPSPIVVEGFKALIVEETDDRSKLPRDQLTALNGTEWRAYVQGRNGDWQLIDDDAPLEKADEWVKQAMAVPRDSVPWVYVSNGTTGASVALPANEVELLALLKKYGGGE